MLRQCTRFRRSGTACSHLTDYQDGWCRRPDCPGFTRPAVDAAPDSHGSMHGSRRHRAETGDVPVGVDEDLIDDVRVSQRATESFRFHHGGSDHDARVQLRTMLDDFLRESARQRSARGYLTLSHSGYVLVLSPDQDVVIAYRTIHRERTWAQLRAGVRSRFRTRPPRPAQLPPEPGPPVALDAVAAAVDPASVHVTLRALRDYSKLRGFGDGHEAATAALRAELATSLPAAVAVSERDGEAALLRADSLGWLVTIDARTVILIRREPQSERPEGTVGQ